jgi:hypothetical protein
MQLWRKWLTDARHAAHTWTLLKLPHASETVDVAYAGCGGGCGGGIDSLVVSDPSHMQKGIM